MPQRASYDPGTPCWVDLATPDIEASERFYGELLGWEIPELPNSAEMGGYRRAKKDGKDVAGAMPLMKDDQPPAWSTYVSVSDAGATAAAVAENGGTVIAEPMAVSDYGTLAVFTDPEGAFFGVWEPNTFPGAELVNEPGTIGWNELGTRDTAQAKQFYSTIFGWDHQDEDSERAGTYTVWKVGDAMVGGMLDLNAIEMPAVVPPHWLVYFEVEDTDAAVAKVESGGGEIRLAPIDLPVGRFAIAADQFGAVFAVIRPSGEGEDS
jgi:predicted enzyme related to lactoylglutathione lyase